MNYYLERKVSERRPPSLPQTSTAPASTAALPAVVIATASEEVNHPSHYNTGDIEVIDAIEVWKLGFHLGNVVKYVARSAHKGTEITDLKKAAWYLNRKIEQLELEATIKKD